MNGKPACFEAGEAEKFFPVITTHAELVTCSSLKSVSLKIVASGSNSTYVPSGLFGVLVFPFLSWPRLKLASIFSPANDRRETFPVVLAPPPRSAPDLS